MKRLSEDPQFGNIGDMPGLLRYYEPAVGCWLPLRVVAWTGGSAPTREAWRNVHYRGLVRRIWREQVADCGGLGLWACAGTSAMERARIFWNRAKHDAWASVR